MCVCVGGGRWVDGLGDAVGWRGVKGACPLKVKVYVILFYAFIHCN